MVNKNKDGRGKNIKNKNESEEWEPYDPVAWHNAWGNPARGNGQTPGASSGSAAAADRW